jgi:hypothetical protein
MNRSPAPRIPRTGRAHIPVPDQRAAWYETTALRVLAIVVGSVCLALATNALMAWLAGAA